MGNKIDKPKQTASQLVAKMKNEKGILFEYTSEKDAEIRSIFSRASADPAFYRTEAARDFRRNRLYVCSVYPQASSLFYAGQLSDCNDKRK